MQALCYSLLPPYTHICTHAHTHTHTHTCTCTHTHTHTHTHTNTQHIHTCIHTAVVGSQTSHSHLELPDLSASPKPSHIKQFLSPPKARRKRDQAQQLKSQLEKKAQILSPILANLAVKVCREEGWEGLTNRWRKGWIEGGSKEGRKAGRQAERKGLRRDERIDGFEGGREGGREGRKERGD